MTDGIAPVERVILEAIQRVVDPNATNQQRLAAYHAIEQLREGPADVLARVGFFLVDQTTNSIAQHNGWNLINDLIRYKWLSMNTDMRLEIRNRVLRAAEIGPNPSIIEQLAGCIETMMEHEWPQNWPSLTEDLEKVSCLGLSQTALVYTVFRRIVENVVTLCRLSVGARKKDLSTALTIEVPKWVCMAIHRLQACSSDDFGASCAVRIIDFLTECVEWMPLKFDKEDDQSGAQLLIALVDALYPHLATAAASLYEHVANCLTGIAARKRDKKSGGSVIEAFFRQAPLETILRTTSLAAEEAHASKQHYSYLKALAVLLITLGNNLSQEWTRKDEKPPFFDIYLSAAVALFYHPSMILKYESLEVFVMLKNNAILTDDPAFNEAIEKILVHMPDAMQRRDVSSRSEDAVYRHFSQMDFDSEMERQEQFIKLRTRIQPFVTACIPKHLTRLLSLVDEFVFQRTLNNAEIVPQEWEPMQKFAKFVLQTAADKGAFNDDQFEALFMVSERLVDLMYGSSDWNRISEVMSVHSAMIFVYERHPESMEKYLQLLHRCLSESGGHKLLNRHCISQILRLVNIYPKYFESKCDLIVKICASVEDKISAMQMAQLVQILAALSNIVPMSQKCQLLEMAVTPCVSYFQGITDHLQSAQTFIWMNGFDVEAPTVFDEGDNRPDIQRRKELRRHLTTIEGVLQQVNSESPLGNALVSIIPLFFQMARVLHDLYSDGLDQRVHSSYGTDIAGITHAERQLIYCSNGENMEALTGRSIEEKREPNTFAKQFINDLNDHILSIISLLSSKFPSTLFNLPQIVSLLEMTTWNLNKIPSFRLRFWIKKTWKSLITNCPSNRFECITNLFSTVVEHLQQRLDDIWKEVCSIDYDAEPTEEELFNEHLCAVLSREYVNFLRICYLANSTEVCITDEKKPQHMPGELGKWLIEHEIGLTSAVKSSFNALSWRDTQCVAKAITLCRMFIETIPWTSDEVAVYMLMSVLSSIQIHGADPALFAPLSSLVFQTYFVFRKFCNVLTEVLAQIPNISRQSIETFDNKIKEMITGNVAVSEKEKKTLMKHLLQPLVEPLLSEQHKRPFTLRELPPLYRKPKIAKDPSLNNDDIDVSVLFSG